MTDELELPIHLGVVAICGPSPPANVTVPEPMMGSPVQRPASIVRDDGFLVSCRLTCVFIIPNPVARVPSTAGLNPPLEPDTPHSSLYSTNSSVRASK